MHHFAAHRRSVAIGAALAALAGSVLASAVTAAPASAWPSSTVSITGHGYGHGRGMGQYGAFGYATTYGWSYTQILSHYYGGTHLASAGNPAIRVELSALAGAPLTVVSQVAYTAGGVLVPAGHAARIALAGQKWTLATSASCGGAFTAAKPVATPVVAPRVAPASPAGMLTVCAGQRSYRGTLTLVNSGGLHVVDTLPLESYLRGVVPRESPASWGDAAGGRGIAALQAQAVAARTYALNDHRYPYADICDSQNCQVYGGAALNGSSIEDPRTDRAVAGTAGMVLRDAGGNLVSAEYSSSTGGWTAGGAFPAVPDLGDTVAPDHDWTQSIDATAVGSAFGVGRVTGLTVTRRNGLGADGGRVLAILVQGSGGAVTVTGDTFQQALGLPSDWFSIGRPAVSPYLLVSNSPTAAWLTSKQLFGWNGDIPITCDWNGDHRDTGGVYRNGVFYLRNSLAGNTPLTTIPYGRAGDLPVCGDWNGDGIDTIGVYDPSDETFFLRNSNTAGPAQLAVRIGIPGDTPVAGDFNGDGKDTVGVFRPSTSTFYLLTSNASAAPHLTVQYGGPGDLPVVGDFNGDGKDTIGVFRNGVFDLSNRLGGPVNLRYTLGGPGDLPLMGDWNGDRVDTPGVAVSYTSY